MKIKIQGLIRTSLLMIFMLLLSSGFTSKHQDCEIKVSPSLSKDKNEKLKVNLGCEVLDFNLKIMNKWGDVVFETSDYNEEIDLHLDERNSIIKKGEVYVWFIKFKTGEQVIRSSGKLFIE